MTARSSARARALFQLPALVVAALAPGTPAGAQDYATRDVGAWLVSPSSDRQGCFLTRTYPAPRDTTVQFGLDVDGANRLTVLSPNWSIRAKERLRLDFRLAKASFPRHTAIGIAAEGKRGFVTTFGAAFPDHLAASPFLHIRRGDVPVEELSLDGSGAAIGELRACVARYRAAPVPPRATTKGDRRRIPLDPFAKRDSRQ